MKSVVQFVAAQPKEVVIMKLLLSAGRIATLLRLTGPTRGRKVSLKMEGIFFQGILAWVIRCYQ